MFYCLLISCALLFSTVSPESPACSLSVTPTSPILNSGDELILQCSCVVSQSENTTFFFYKDRQGDFDQDIRERVEELPDDKYRMEFTKLDAGLQLRIPFVRTRDTGSYECGYQIAGEEQRRFLNSTLNSVVNVTVKGKETKFENSPFGYDKYDITLGLWQRITIDYNGENITAPQDQIINLGAPILQVTVPQFLDESVLSVQVHCPTQQEPLSTEWFGYGQGISCFNKDFGTPNNRSLVLENKDHQFQSLTLSYLAFEGPPDFVDNIQPAYEFNYSINYTLAKGAQLPSYYPEQLSFTMLFPSYEERVVAPLARYTVLSMAYNDYEYISSWYDRYLQCVVCSTNSILRTRCPFGVSSSVPTWTLGDGTVIDSVDNEFYKVGVAHELEIKKVDMSLGQRISCTFNYHDQTTQEPAQATAEQDVIVEARKPLKPKDVEFPLRQTVEENFTLELYLDIAMRQDLYEEIVKVKWGRVTEQGEEEWFPNDHRQNNDWRTKHLFYEIQNFTENASYICHVTYLQRAMSIQIPVQTMAKPPPVSNIVSSLTKNALTFSWNPVENDQNNYFDGYEVRLTRRSAASYISDPPQLLDLSSDGEEVLSRDPRVKVPGDLRPFSIYTVSVVAVYEFGRSVEKSVSQKTLEAEKLCKWITKVDMKMKKKIKGMPNMTQSEAKVACKADGKCKAITCTKKTNKCWLNAKPKGRTHTKFTALVKKC